jgi:two-component system, response regulator YesN
MDSIRQSHIILNQRIILGKSQLIVDDSINKNIAEFQNTLDPENEKMLLLYIQQNQWDLFKKQLKKFISFMETNSFPQLRLERTLKQIIGLLFNVYSFLPEAELLSIDQKINELITGSISYSTIYLEMCHIIDKILEQKKIYKQNNNYHKTLVDKVEGYIKSNYNSPVTLQSIADTFSISAPYLSKIYKKYKCISPTDHIINLRIEKAKQLLFIDFSMTIKDIAKSVGYDDPFYFSRLFKSVTGSSPVNFRLEK